MKSEGVKFKEVRVRMAPAPTGLLHIGTARTTLFNYLFAKKNSGRFILRIEDTDWERSKPEFEKNIIENLQWLGLQWDEFYRQSERKEIYAKYLEKLLATGKAYYCFCTEEEIESKRQEQMSRGEAPKYNGKCQNLSQAEVKKLLSENKPSIIRFKMPSKKVKFRDLIKGEVEFDSSLIGDIAIAKNLTTPLYNFAAVVDDFEMRISHIIRGEDHLSNTPKQLLLQEALGLTQPQYGHTPMILGPDKSKLSKRHGSTSVADYRQDGYLPEALINFMAFLGWNPDTEREIFSLASLAKEFSLEKVQKSGAIFNIQRLNYLNGFYIRQKSVKKLAELCQPYLPETDQMYIEKVVAMYQERLKKLSEIKELAEFFFKDKLMYDKELLKWKDMTDKEIVQSLDKLENLLSEIAPTLKGRGSDRGVGEEKNWTKENLEKVLMAEAERMGPSTGLRVKDKGYLLWPLRVALSGQKASAGPFDIAAVLGKEKTLKRIKDAKSKI